MPEARPLPILIVEDDEIVALGLSAALRRDGFSTVVHGDGRAAVASLDRERFALVLTDLRMPGVCGFEVLAAAQRCRPAPPVVVMSGYPSRDAAEEARRRGAAVFLVKPIDYPRLRGVVERYLQRPVRVTSSAPGVVP